MTQHAPTGDRLRVTPSLEVGDREFLAGFSRSPARSRGSGRGSRPCRRPGRPASRGAVCVLVATRSAVEAAGQWLRFMIGEFLGDRHHLDGRLVVPGLRGRGSTLLIVEAGEVFEGEVEEGLGAS